MKKLFSTRSILILISFLFVNHLSRAQKTTKPPKMVKIYLKNSSWLPKGVGLKSTYLNGEITTSYQGGWMPLASKPFELPVGARLEYVKEKSAIMNGNPSNYKGKLIVEIKETDEGKTFTF